MQSTTTPWFPSSTTPTRNGLYQVKVLHWQGERHMTWWSYWNGIHWSSPEAVKASAWRSRHQISLLENFSWRGLAASPAGESAAKKVRKR